MNSCSSSTNTPKSARRTTSYASLVEPVYSQNFIAKVHAAESSGRKLRKGLRREQLQWQGERFLPPFIAANLQTSLFSVQMFVL